MAAAHSATSPLAFPLTLDLGAAGSVSALLQAPPEPTRPIAAFVLAHGAGAGMAHPFMAQLAAGLAERRIATLRYQFAYMERGSKRPDPPALAHAAVRAAVVEAGRRLPGLPLVAGGKSFGGRMTSQAQAATPLPGVRGLVFVGFPLHPAGKPASERAEHLDHVACPMLFLQGTRDELADLPLLKTVLARLGPRATLEVFDDADHSFHVRASSGRNDAQVMALLLDATAAWIESLAGAGPDPAR
ncbi:MAG: dienelactone hydrolase family protein [Burkholderiales bacterium]|nr:dienelactone hydrolase family protein [Burkholderiales bacterium]